MADLDTLRRRVEHVIVVMLENRSFDHLLGYLDHPNPAYERLSPSDEFSNLEDPTDPASPRWRATPDGRPYAPVDPDHSHDAVKLQLGLAARGAPNNSGFVASYLHKAGPARVIEARKAGFELGSVVMGCLTEERVPAISRLAREFAICTRWFSSVPGETWPNRNFVHSATSDYTVNIELGVYLDPTIFELLDAGLRHPEERRRAWRIYWDGPAQVMAFRNLWDDERIGNWAPIEEFRKDVHDGRLARYSFIEPNHHTPGARLLDPESNSQHPGNNLVPIERYPVGGGAYGADFHRGDALIADLYEALRGEEELFQKTLLVITYDEHGGWYDHVPPPAAVPPGDRRNRGFLRSIIERFSRRGRRFDFKRLGARVPAVAVSPWIPPHTLDDTILEHASVPRAVRELFRPDAKPLTARDAAANSFVHLVGALNEPRSELPSLEDLVRPAAERAALVEEAEVPPDSFQRSLDALALIVGDNLDRPVDALVAGPIQPVALREVTQPLPSTAEQAASAMERFRAKARESR